MRNTLFMNAVQRAMDAGKPDGLGPRKHCGVCGGEHRARACSLVLVARKAKSGREVQRWTRNTLAGDAPADE